MIIELKQEEVELLTVVLAAAFARAKVNGDPDTARRLMMLTNSVHKSNPAWRPYPIEEVESK